MSAVLQRERSPARPRPGGGRGPRGAPAAVAVAATAIASVVLVALWGGGGADHAAEQAVEVDLPPMVAPPPDLRQTLRPEPARAADPVATARPDPANSLSVPAVTAAAFAGIPLPAPEAALRPAPDPALVEESPAGPLPRRAADGRVPWQTYARPFARGDDRPRIAVIVSGLGIGPTETREIIRRLPGAVTLSFAPFAPDVYGWGQAARASGHEILLGLPIQGEDFPFTDAGPTALAPDLSLERNRARLAALLARMTGYVGVLDAGGGVRKGDGGAADAGDAGQRAAIEADLGRRGLLVVDEQSAVRSAGSADEDGAPRLRLDLKMSGDDGIAAIRARLALLEALARARGYAVGVVEPSPAAVAELAAWAAALSGKNLVLAPVSAVAAATSGLAL